MDRGLITFYSVLIVTTTLLATIASIWLGPSTELEGIAGMFGPFKRVRSLFAIPVMLALIGIVGALSQSSTRFFWSSPEALTPEARHGLKKYLSTERQVFLGVGVVFSAAQLLAILSAAGLVLPYEFGARALFFFYGALCVCAGNMTPKVPFFGRWWQIDRTVYTKVSRFGGLSLMVGGVAACLLAIFAPFERVSTWTILVISAAVVIMIGNALIHALLVSIRRT